MRSRQLAVSFDSWVRKAETAQRHASLLRKAALRMRGDKLSVSFDGWIAFLAQQDRARVAMARLLNSTVSKALRSWELWVSQHIASQEKMRKAVHVMTHRTTTTVMHTWHEWMKDRQRLDSLLKRAVVQMTHHQLCVAFDRWHDTLCATKADRELRMRVAINQMGMRSVAMAYRAWT